MNRQEKKLIIDTLKNDFQKSQASFLVGVQGISVADVQVIRKGLHKEGARLKVAKNTFLKIAIQDLPGIKDLADYFKDQIAVVFADKEALSIAKTLSNKAKEIEKFKIIAGSLNDKVLVKSQIEQLASLPSKEVMLGQAIIGLKAPISKLVMTLDQQRIKLLLLLKQNAAKRQQEG